MNSTNRIRSNLGNRVKLSNQASNAVKKVANTGQAIKNRVTNVAQSVTNTVREKVANAQKKVSNIGETPAISKLGAMTQEFFNANSAISNFVMFILCILLFVILFQIGSSIVFYLFGPQYNPYILNGMVPSNVKKVISANPNVAESIPIFRSINKAQGIEFTWNVWFMVQDVTGIENTKGGALIFSKGSNTTTAPEGTSVNKYLNVSPGLFLVPGTNSNSLIVVLNTFNASNSQDSEFQETITIPDIPMQKWICCTIRVQGTYVDVYINGVLTKRTILVNIPKQNYYDTYVGDSSGFKGYISSLRYYSKAINYDEIQALFSSGPSLKMNASDQTPNSSDYLSMNWYYKYKNIASS